MQTLQTAPSAFEPAPAPVAPTRHPLVRRLVDEGFATHVDAGNTEWIDGAGTRVLFICGDTVRFPAVLDVAVILPELAKAFAGAFDAAVIDDTLEDTIAARFGATKRPSLVFVRDGKWLGTIPAVLDWTDYVAEVRTILTSEPRRAPGVGIAVKAVGMPGSAA